MKGLLDLGRAMELSETQPSGIESQSSSPFDEVNYTRASQRPPVREPIARSSTCGHCGNAYPHPQGQLSCQARGAECRACGKLNNFARVCRSKPISTSLSDRRPRVICCLVRPPPPHALTLSTLDLNAGYTTLIPSRCQVLTLMMSIYLFTLAISQVRDVRHTHCCMPQYHYKRDMYRT